jgi:hypothetical protein
VAIPAYFLINPAGIIFFGANAGLNVPAFTTQLISDAGWFENAAGAEIITIC